MSSATQWTDFAMTLCHPLSLLWCPTLIGVTSYPSTLTFLGALEIFQLFTFSAHRREIQCIFLSGNGWSGWSAQASLPECLFRVACLVEVLMRMNASTEHLHRFKSARECSNITFGSRGSGTASPNGWKSYILNFLSMSHMIPSDTMRWYVHLQNLSELVYAQAGRLQPGCLSMREWVLSSGRQLSMTVPWCTNCRS